MTAAPPKRVLLTGGTGFLGHYLLAELLSESDLNVRVLVRPGQESRPRLQRLLTDLDLDPDRFMSRGRLEIVEGTLPEPFDSALLEGVHTIVHAAASIRFEDDGTGEPLRTNVHGTQKLLDCAQTHGVSHFVYISTAYVCGQRSGTIEETVISDPASFCNDYERSKWMAEKLVWNWSKRSCTSTICRPSILFGDSRTGRTTSLGGIYLIFRATELLARAVGDDPEVDRHRIPLRILGRSAATCNLVPVDWVARGIVRIIQNPAKHGRVHHLTNPIPPTHAEIKGWLQDFYDIAGAQFSGETWPLTDANDYEQLFYALGSVVSDYFRDGLVFATPRAEIDTADRRLVDQDRFNRSIRFAQSHRWGRKTSASDHKGQHHAVVDPEWYFGVFLPDRVPHSCVARVHTLTTVVRFVIGDRFDQWVCRFDGGQLVDVFRGEGGLREEFGFEVTRDVFAALVSGRVPLQKSFFDGQAHIFGNIERALRMVPIITAFINEFPVHDNKPT